MSLIRRLPPPFVRLIAGLTQPTDTVIDPEKRQQGHLLTALLLVFAFLCVPLVLFWSLNKFPNVALQYFFGQAFIMHGLLMIAYLFSRKGHFIVAASVAVVSGSAAIFASSLVAPPDTAVAGLYYLSVVVFFSSLFLPARLTVVTIAGHLVTMGLVAGLRPDIQPDDPILDPLLFYCVLSLLGLLMSRYARSLANARQARLMQSEDRYRIISELISDFALAVRVNPDGSLINEWTTASITRASGLSMQEFQSMDPFSRYHPEDAGRLMADMQRVLKGEIVQGEYRAFKKNGDVFWLRMYRQPVWDEKEQRVVRYYSVVQDITDRKRAELAEQEQRLFAEKLNEICTLLGSTLNLNEVLNRILDAINLVIPSDGTGIMLIEGDTAWVVRYHDRIKPELSAKIAGTRFALSEIDDMKAIVTTGQANIISCVKEFEGWVPIEGQDWIEANLTVPILLDNKVIGLFSLDSRVPDCFRPEHIERLKAFSPYAAIAIQNARLYEKAQELAVTQERQRLAQELHDAVNQTLFSANLIAETLPKLRERDPEGFQEGLSDLQRFTKGALAGMQTSLFEMRTDALVETDLGDLIGYLVDSMLGKRHDIAISWQREGGGKLPPLVHMALYRIVQEALNYAVNHSRATHLNVKLEHRREEITITIKDDGPESGSLNGDHNELQAMHEQAVAVGAQMDVARQADKGTQIQLSWNAN